MRYYCVVDQKTIILFDDNTKTFGIFSKIKGKVEEGVLRYSERKMEILPVVISEDEARRNSKGQKLLKCGKCGEIGHGKRAHVTPYDVLCNDCSWRGKIDLHLMDGKCPAGHLHLTKL